MLGQHEKYQLSQLVYKKKVVSGVKKVKSCFPGGKFINGEVHQGLSASGALVVFISLH